MSTKEPKYSHVQKVNTVFLLLYRYKGDTITMSTDMNISEDALKKWRVRHETEAIELMEKAAAKVDNIDDILMEGVQRVFDVIKTCPHPDKIVLAMSRLLEIENRLPLGKNGDGKTISEYIRMMNKLAENHEAKGYRV